MVQMALKGYVGNHLAIVNSCQVGKKGQKQDFY